MRTIGVRPWFISESAATMPAMADWRQIQARIRKAKNSTDARTKLSELYQRTRDAMVSWELAAIEEKAEHADEAIKWYTVSAERFRRADWKKKAEEALTRLGAPIPVAGDKSASKSAEAQHEDASEPNGNTDSEAVKPRLAVGEIAEDESDADDAEESDDASAEDSDEESSEVGVKAEGVGDGSAANGDGKKKRRRGRRGGRGRRRKGGAATATNLPSTAFAENRSTPAPAASSPSQEARPTASHREDVSNFRSEPSDRRPSAYAAEHDHARHSEKESPAPMLPSERIAHGRAGDPALASRMAKLDSMLRRLIASQLHKMDDVDSAPAGPGVFLLSDSDQITSYYIESCQTLRVGLGNLVRGGGNRTSAKPARSGPAGRQNYDSSGFKSKLADHLGIGEAKVSQYLKDHCVVRWIQLDDDAHHLAHFAIGVLRTPLNVD
jgi:hypothetical protein